MTGFNPEAGFNARLGIGAAANPTNHFFTGGAMVFEDVSWFLTVLTENYFCAEMFDKFPNFGFNWFVLHIPSLKKFLLGVITNFRILNFV